MKKRSFKRLVFSGVCCLALMTQMSLGVFADTTTAKKDDSTTTTTTAKDSASTSKINSHGIDSSKADKDLVEKVKKLNDGIMKLKPSGQPSDGMGEYGKAGSYFSSLDTVKSQTFFQWMQNDDWGKQCHLPQSGQWNDKSQGDSAMVNNNIFNSGCRSVTVSMLMMMSGILGDDFTPITFYHWGLNLDDSISFVKNVSTCADYGGHKTVWSTSGILQDDSYPAVSEFTNGKFKKSGTAGTDVASIKAELDKGHYVALLVHTPAHYVACVGYDSEDLILADPYCYKSGLCHMKDISSDENKKWLKSKFPNAPDDWVNNHAWTQIDAVHTFECSSSPCDMIIDLKGTRKTGGAVGGASGGGGTEGGDANLEEVGFAIIGANKLDEEYFVTKPALNENDLDLKSKDDLVLNDRENMEEWSNTITYDKADSIHKVVRAVFMIFGIIVTVYSILLFLAFQFDKVNNFVDINLLGIVSMHRFRVMPDFSKGEQVNDEKASQCRYVKFKEMCIISCLGIAIGVLLISGKVFEAVRMLLDLISKIFHSF